MRKSCSAAVNLTVRVQITNLSLIHLLENCVILRLGLFHAVFHSFALKTLLKTTLVREFYLFCKRQLTQKRTTEWLT